MARITVEDCLKQIGNENRFALIHLAVKRVRQHRKGAPFLVKCKNKETVSTLREIAASEVNFENVREFDKLPELKASPEAKEMVNEAYDDTAN